MPCWRITAHCAIGWGRTSAFWRRQGGRLRPRRRAVSRRAAGSRRGLSGGVQPGRGAGTAGTRHHHAHSDPGPHAAGPGGRADPPAHHPGRFGRGQGRGIQRRSGEVRRHAEDPTSRWTRACPAWAFCAPGEHFEGGVSRIAHSCALPGLEAEGIFTHFSVSDEPGAENVAYTKAQFDLFRRVIGALEQQGCTFCPAPLRQQRRRGLLP